MSVGWNQRIPVMFIVFLDLLNDGFTKLNGMKLPDHFEYLYNVDSLGCKQWCLSNCSCVAYAYVTGIGCMEKMRKSEKNKNK
ncbi:hypothetical protein ACSBR1_016100 [Camellia fascicularis]